MEENTLSRRRLMQMGLGAAASAGLASASVAGFVQPAMADSSFDHDADESNHGLSTSVSAAYSFLDQMMDAYAQGNTARLSQSYADQIAGGQFFSTAFTYDNALVLLAYLVRGRRSDLSRAMAWAMPCCMLNRRMLPAMGVFGKLILPAVQTPAEPS